MKKWFYVLIFFVFCFAFCARQSSPSGGLKDETAPTLLESSPKNGQTNVKSIQKIVLTFNEYITEKQAKQKIVFSPTLKEDYEIYFKGKSMVLKLEEKLLENTTYHIGFGNSLADITEGNIIENLNFVFSTGNQIDSLNIAGKAIDAETGLALENAIAVLYTSQEDSLIFKEKPNYISKIKDNGTFEFSFLPNKDFQIAVIQEENSNFIHDDFDEKIAFSNNFINSKDSLNDSLLLKLFSPTIAPKVVKPVLDNFLLKLPNTKDSIKNIKAIDKEVAFLSQYNFTQDSIFYFYNELSDSNLTAIITFDDLEKTDTVEIENIKSENVDSLVRITQNNHLTIRQKQKIDLLKNLELKTKYPIEFLDDSKIRMYNLQDTSLVETNILKKENYETIISINANWLPETNYQLIVDSAAIKNWFGKVNKTDTLYFSSEDTSSYTAITLKFLERDSLKNYYAKLYNQFEMEILKTPIISDSLVFENLLQGSYFIKIIEDENNNGKFDNGNYALKLQPERTINLENGKAIKLNGSLELEMEVDLK